MLRTRTVLTSLAVALPAAFVVTYAVESWRARDMRTTLERVVAPLINEQMHERCESDPMWFITGPLQGRPKPTDPVNPDPDALKPRARLVEQPFELFAYDEELIGSSTATPRFPSELRFPLRQSDGPVFASFPTPAGVGVQMAVTSGWRGGSCAVLLARMRPMSGEGWKRVLLFSGVFVVSFLVALAATTPIVWRVRRLAADARESANENYASIAPDNSKDEISALTFVFNEAAKEIHGRGTGMTDRDDAMRRFMTATAEHVAKPLADLEARLVREGTGPSAPDRAAIAREVNELSAYMANLAVAARLRGKGDPIRRDEVDLGSAIRRVADRYAAAAANAGVTIRVVPPSAPVMIIADAALVDHAIGNLVHNAIRYNRRGGTVTLTLTRGDNARLLLRVVDDGQGVSDEELKSLSAIRRFRGDEGRDRQPGVPGLGLAVAREVIERAGLQMELDQATPRGFQVTVSG